MGLVGIHTRADIHTQWRENTCDKSTHSLSHTQTHQSLATIIARPHAQERARARVHTHTHTHTHTITDTSTGKCTPTRTCAAMEAAAREEAEYMKAATKAKSLGDMQSVIAGGGIPFSTVHALVAAWGAASTLQLFVAIFEQNAFAEEREREREKAVLGNKVHDGGG
jgi:hypothetical protein